MQSQTSDVPATSIGSSESSHSNSCTALTVATAPTPARTQGTPFPTQGTRVVTATPDSPVAGSTAAIENVWNTSSAPQAAGSWAAAWAPGTASLVLGVSLFGLAVGNVLMLQPLILAHAFGIDAFTRLYAVREPTEISVRTNEAAVRTVVGSMASSRAFGGSAPGRAGSTRTR